MYKYHIYSDQFDFFHFLREDFQGDLKTGQFALGDSQILLQMSDAAKTQKHLVIGLLRPKFYILAKFVQFFQKVLEINFPWWMVCILSIFLKLIN